MVPVVSEDPPPTSSSLDQTRHGCCSSAFGGMVFSQIIPEGPKSAEWVLLGSLIGIVTVSIARLERQFVRHLQHASSISACGTHDSALDLGPRTLNSTLQCKGLGFRL